LISTLVHPAAVRAAVLDPSGKYVATTCEDRYVRIWDAESGQPTIAPAIMPKIPELFRHPFSKDGRLLLVNSGKVFLLDTMTGQIAAPPLEPRGAVIDSSFSGDGKSILIATTGGIFCWTLPVLNQSVLQLKSEAELLSGHRINANGVVEAIDSVTWLQAWQSISSPWRAD
jgi:WD40 repeat protein